MQAFQNLRPAERAACCRSRYHAAELRNRHAGDGGFAHLRSDRWSFLRSGRHLTAAFAFGQLAPGPERRGQPDHLRSRSSIPGVIAVNLTAFNLSGERQASSPISSAPAAPFRRKCIRAQLRPPARRFCCSIRPRKATWGCGHEHERASPIYSLSARGLPHRDAAQGGPLQALFAVLESQYGLVQDNVWQLYDDQFIETCAPWVIPYIGQLIGYNTVYTAALTSPDSRAEVANTIGYRRRKGTLVALEQITHDVSGRTTIGVEEFSRLVTTLSLRDVRPRNYATASLRTGCDLGRPGGPFTRSIAPSTCATLRRAQSAAAHSPDPTPLDIALHGGGPLQHSGCCGLDVALAKLRRCTSAPASRWAAADTFSVRWAARSRSSRPCDGASSFSSLITGSGCCRSRSAVRRASRANLGGFLSRPAWNSSPTAIRSVQPDHVRQSEPEPGAMCPRA